MSASLHTTNVLERNESERQPLPVSAANNAGARRASFGAWVVDAIPTALVLAALGGLAYWGHHTGWTLPKFSALIANRNIDKDDWCGAHAVPESECVECNPDLMPKSKDYGWCDKHGVPNCPLEHPDVAQLKHTPQVAVADLERAARALALMPRPKNNRGCKLHLRRIQFASEEAFARAGIKTDSVWRSPAPMVECVSANGEVTYDPTRVARLSSRVPGTVWRVDKKVGDAVKQGEVVALVETLEVGRAKAEFLQAVAQFRLKTRTYQSLRDVSGAVAGQRIREAETALDEAHIHLLSAQQALVNLGLPVDADDLKNLPASQLATQVQFLGLPTSLRQTLNPKTTTANLLPIKAPLDGVVVDRNVVAEEVVDTTKVLLVVADVRQMWLTLNVRQEDAGLLNLGQPVRFRTNGSPMEVTGTVSWISTAVDEKTRTVRVRADLANPQGRLRANSFGNGRVVLREEKDAIIVPNEAVHWEGDCFVVFVQDKNFPDANGLKVFHTRTIRPGARDDKYTEIIAGVLPGEIIATEGSGIMRSELLKNNMGEG
ncbi:MAG TPA: efflux RND transporter periplasmic adaptor subunit [Gemmataceae bacterium]|nr:efflux RND transporter periplasmic adaptor subunit [Gemmataceae bacterium]